jgi:hypothetical protein
METSSSGAAKGSGGSPTFEEESGVRRSRVACPHRGARAGRACVRHQRAVGHDDDAGLGGVRFRVGVGIALPIRITDAGRDLIRVGSRRLRAICPRVPIAGPSARAKIRGCRINRAARAVFRAGNDTIRRPVYVTGTAATITAVRCRYMRDIRIQPHFRRRCLQQVSLTDG